MTMGDPICLSDPISVYIYDFLVSILLLLLLLLLIIIIIRAVCSNGACGFDPQMKLLNLYIKRAQTGSAGADPTTDVSGQS